MINKNDTLEEIKQKEIIRIINYWNSKKKYAENRIKENEKKLKELQAK
jgi:hypothetical protein|tara:strand:+ start:1140 stop:1283 length:144 start_codon:yes stop_codon:yes gene_type:complete